MTKKDRQILKTLADILERGAWDVVWTDRECFHARWATAKAVMFCALTGDTGRFGWYLGLFQRRVA